MKQHSSALMINFVHQDPRSPSHATTIWIYKCFLYAVFSVFCRDFERLGAAGSWEKRLSPRHWKRSNLHSQQLVSPNFWLITIGLTRLCTNDFNIVWLCGYEHHALMDLLPILRMIIRLIRAGLFVALIWISSGMFCVSRVFNFNLLGAFPV
jgi:hypothetical protein